MLKRNRSAQEHFGASMSHVFSTKEAQRAAWIVLSAKKRKIYYDIAHRDFMRFHKDLKQLFHDQTVQKTDHDTFCSLVQESLVSTRNAFDQEECRAAWQAFLPHTSELICGEFRIQPDTSTRPNRKPFKALRNLEDKLVKLRRSKAQLECPETMLLTITKLRAGDKWGANLIVSIVTRLVECVKDHEVRAAAFVNCAERGDVASVKVLARSCVLPVTLKRDAFGALPLETRIIVEHVNDQFIRLVHCFVHTSQNLLSVALWHLVLGDYLCWPTTRGDAMHEIVELQEERKMS